MPTLGFGFRFLSPVRRLDQSQAGGGLGEHCSSPAVGRGVCAPPSRVAQPRLLVADRGNPRRGRQTGVAFFLVTFSLAKQEKVTSCRATPDGFDFDAFATPSPQPSPARGEGVVVPRRF